MFKVDDWVESRAGWVGQITRIVRGECYPILVRFPDNRECCYAEDELQQVGPLCPHCGHVLEAQGV